VFTMQQWTQILLTALLAVIGSSGFWAYLQRRDSKKSKTDLLLQGLAYDRIIAMGMSYIERGWITNDEYNDYRKLYDAYRALGGNGVTERIMAEVSSLPLKQRAKYAEVIREAKTRGATNDDTEFNHIPDAA
jgi:hypothetical protein